MFILLLEDLLQRVKRGHQSILCKNRQKISTTCLKRSKKGAMVGCFHMPGQCLDVINSIVSPKRITRVHV